MKAISAVAVSSLLPIFATGSQCKSAYSGLLSNTWTNLQTVLGKKGASLSVLIVKTVCDQLQRFMLQTQITVAV